MTPTEKTRTELLTALTELSRVRPHWRLGQTIANLATTAGKLNEAGIWDLEDDEALAAAKLLLAQADEAQPAVA